VHTDRRSTPTPFSTPTPVPATPPATAEATRLRARRARIVIGVLVAAVALASLPFLPGLFGALVLAALVGAPYRRLAPRIGPHRAAFVLAVASTALLVAPLALVLATAVHEAPVVLQHVLSSTAFARLSELHVGPLDVGEQIAGASRNLVSWISSRAMRAAGSVTRALLNLLLAVVGLYYLLPSGPTLWRRVRGFLPFSSDGSDHLAERFASITEAAVLGILAAGASQGITVGLGFWLVGLPNPAFWGAVTALVSVLPILGSSLVWLPGTVVLVLSQRPGAAIVLALIGVVISSNIDNVVRPVVYRRVSGLHPMASLLGAFAGMELFGLLGLVLGPLGVAYCLELVRLYELEFGTP
jgi:predicted PurR-regulated permease PerM